ncbi:MAG: 4-hydroxythreonine-4-phosphate dehydrogenase PdxA [Desulfuromonas sp.]|nr:MAG: 4-hydroxythreonine-4-phosphate dehydrogenase PdxA [Desulfuromonas sp.]
MDQKPIIITMGDPTGVGPELICKALHSGALDQLGKPLLVAGDPHVMLQAAQIFAPAAELNTADNGRFRLGIGHRALTIHPLSHLNPQTLRYGQPDRACGRAMADYIEWAADRCLTDEATALVTCPINKAAINAAGIAFPGHTELLAERCSVPKVVMMLAGSTLKVCLVTTHLALQQVPQALSTAEILETIRIVDRTLRSQFGIKKPRLAVLSLNPHAGESGLFGDEEPRLIIPAIEAAVTEGICASGPHSADTLFYFAVRGDYDAVICMYHDQGLIPLKLLHFEDGINVTLGLPIIRTSVDHGTAYDLAGTGAANPQSLIAAITTAAQMRSHPVNTTFDKESP